LAPRAREMAAVLACGAESWVSHRSAASVWEGVPEAKLGGDVEVTVPRAMRRRIEGIVTHRSRFLTSEDFVRHESLPITTPARTLLDLATVLPSPELERAIARADRSGLVPPSDLLERARACAKHPGALTIRRLLENDQSPAFTRSEAEARLLDLVRRGRLLRPQVNARLNGYEVDLLWAVDRLVVEVDGFAYHSSERAFTNDRRRDAALTAAGFRVVRITWNDITKQPEATLVMLAQALARR
jgi:very-short-patch-repair endonuclease